MLRTFRWPAALRCGTVRFTPVADPAVVSSPAVARAGTPDSPRHSLFVRITHWISAAAFAVLLLSGIAILLAHPRLYWGETGAVGGPSLIDLPLPFVLDVPIRGPGRYLHFLAAWVCVATGLVYVLIGFVTGHFARSFLPRRGELTVRAIRDVVDGHLRATRGGEDVPTAYNVLQRLTYAGVVFVMLPLMICTGLAMSPAVTSVVPALVTAFGGQQSARTIHFFVTCALTLFLLLHVALVWQSGFTAHMRAMITGRRSRAGAARREAA
jgi:thiosulfate reductase cytochrome b subunit